MFSVSQYWSITIDWLKTCAPHTYYFKAQALWFPGHRISWVSDWLSDWVCDFFPWASSAIEVAKNEIWHKGSLQDEDDAWTLNTCIAQREHTIPHLTMKNNRCIIECCNNTHRGAPHTGKQTSACISDLGDASHVTC